jgi:plastocyanin
MSQTNGRLIVLGIGVWLMMLAAPLAASATVGWKVGDMVLDFGLDLESGEQKILVDKYEVGAPFFVELTWKLNSNNCLLQVQESTASGDSVSTKTVRDDGLLNGVVSHVAYHQVEAVIVTAAEGTHCEIDPAHDEFLVVAREPRAPASAEEGLASAPLGAVVVVFRATTFFMPREVTIKPGEKVVWVYADGAQEPHSVTSGGCRVNDCSGGGQHFNSGLTVNKPGQRFEHVFRQSGIFPYHCDLHLGSMQGTVAVQAPHEP